MQIRPAVSLHADTLCNALYASVSAFAACLVFLYLEAVDALQGQINANDDMHITTILLSVSEESCVCYAVGHAEKGEKTVVFGIVA